MYETIYLNLKMGFNRNQSWFKFLFMNTALERLLIKAEVPSAWDFFRTYLDSWWLNRFWFRACIQNPLQQRFDNILRSLQVLMKSEIWTKENCNAVATHVHPQYLAFALSELDEARILTQENFSLVSVYAYPNYLAIALSCLHQARILTLENRGRVVDHTVPYGLSIALSSLHQAGILTQESFDLVSVTENSYYLANALTTLHQARILTQANVFALVAPNHVALLSEAAERLIWSRIPFRLFTQTNFQRLLIASEHAHPMEELHRVLNQILVVQHDTFNSGQSTHAASVHQSVSACAVKLMTTYGEDLDFEAKIQEIITDVNSLDDAPKHQAAKRCIARITERDYIFSDTSGISARQLLALAYTAIHDGSKRSGTLEDARTLFVEGLYEIQRGYNLNARGDDLGGKDRPICNAGTFNKLMEKLNGIHQDVELLFITPAGAALKLSALAKAHALSYLKTLSFAETEVDYQRMKQLLEGIKTNENLELIWEKIKPSVQVELWNEFKAAFGDGDTPTDARFLSLIDYGSQIPAPDLTEIETALLASPGYQVYQEKLVRLSLERNGLWANRQLNAEAQENFDQQYGLILRF